MKRLHDLAKQLKENNFEMTEAMKEHFEEFLSIIAEGSRVLHPRFGLGTVKSAMGNSWVEVDFDRDNESYERKLKDYELNKVTYPGRYFSYPSRHTRAVHIASCHSMHMIIKKEMNR
jgi:hypothetical protein